MKRLFSAVLVLAMVLVMQSAALAAVIISDDQMVGPFEVDLASVVVIDIRSDAETAQDGSEMEGGIRVPLDTLLNSMSLPQDKGADILVVSQDGSAGEIAVLALSKMGYTSVKNLDGGMDAWKMMGFSTVPTEIKFNAPVAGGC